MNFFFPPPGGEFFFFPPPPPSRHVLVKNELLESIPETHAGSGLDSPSHLLVRENQWKNILAYSNGCTFAIPAVP